MAIDCFIGAMAYFFFPFVLPAWIIHKLYDGQFKEIK